MDGNKSYYPRFRVIQKHGNLNRAVIRSKISYMHRFWIFLLTFPQHIFSKALQYSLIFYGFGEWEGYSIVFLL